MLLCVNTDYTKVRKVYEDYVEFRTDRKHKKPGKTKQNKKNKQKIISKEKVENTDLYEAVSNKVIMIIQE